MGNDIACTPDLATIGSQRYGVQSVHFSSSYMALRLALVRPDTMVTQASRQFRGRTASTLVRTTDITALRILHALHPPVR